MDNNNKLNDLKRFLAIWGMLTVFTLLPKEIKWVIIAIVAFLFLYGLSMGPSYQY